MKTALFFLVATFCVFAINAHPQELEPEFDPNAFADDNSVETIAETVEVEEAAVFEETEPEVVQQEEAKPSGLFGKAKAALSKAGAAVKNKYEEVVPSGDRKILAAAKNSMVQAAQIGAAIGKDVATNVAKDVKCAATAAVNNVREHFNKGEAEKAENANSADKQ